MLLCSCALLLCLQNKANLPLVQEIGAAFGCCNDAFDMLLIVFGTDGRYNSQEEWTCDNLAG
jgi:hypothetical protein